MQTYRYVNRTKSKEVRGYLSLYHVKRQIAKAIMECVDLWNQEQRHPTFKIGIEVKAVFTKNHPNVQNPEVDPIIEHRIMFIHRILQKVIVGNLAQIDLEALGSLISSIEWQCLDENHNRDSAHILHNIFEFRIHIYSANAMQAGGGWIPLPERIAGTKAVINPHNEDNYCFVYAVQLGLVDISKEPNCRRITVLQRLVREQGVFINCSLEMPVEPSEKNFKQFEKDNPFLHLNVYTVAANEEKCPITPLYVGMNRSTKIINILYYKNEQTSHYAFIRNISRLIHSATKSHLRKFVCPYCACTYFNTQEALNNHMEKKHPYIDNEFVCEKCLNVFHTQEAKEFHDSICMVKENEPRVIEYPAYDRSIQCEERYNYMLSRIPTWMVADFECILLKEEQLKGLKTKIIHKHQPCAWGLTVVTERKGAPYDQTFVKVSQNVGEAMETFVHKILEIT